MSASTISLSNDRANNNDTDTFMRKATIALQPSFRWVVLVIVCICVYSFIYCYDNPFALQNQLMDEYNLSSVQYNFLYSIYGYVNAISPLLSGLLIDCIGINTSSLLFYFLIVIGQSLWIFGCISYSYPLMILGRGIFGTGAQPFHTSRKYYSFEYFEGKEYSFASGMTLFASRVASATQSYSTTYIYDRTDSIIIALSVGGILVVISLILLILFIIYKKIIFSKKRGIPVDIKTMSLPHILYRSYQRRKMRKNKGESNLLVSPAASKTPLPDDQSKFNLDGLWKGSFDRRFTVLSIEIMAFYSSYLSFTNVGSSFLQARFGYSYDYANSLTPIPFFLAAFTIPLFGFLCDKYGRRCPLLALSASLLIIGHCVLGFTDENTHLLIPIIGLISFGFGMSIGSSILWPTVGLICTKQYLATALGFIGCLDNAWQATSFLIVGIVTKEDKDENGDIHHHTDQYEYVTYWLLFLAVVMLLCSLLLWYYDKHQFDNSLGKMEAKFDKTLSRINRENAFSQVETNKKDSVLMEVDGEEEIDSSSDGCFEGNKDTNIIKLENVNDEENQPKKGHSLIEMQDSLNEN